MTHPGLLACCLTGMALLAAGAPAQDAVLLPFPAESTLDVIEPEAPPQAATVEPPRRPIARRSPVRWSIPSR